MDVHGGDADELPYVEMTRSLLRAFPQGGGSFVVEPDASSASYFVGGEWLLNQCGHRGGEHGDGAPLATGWQIDAELPRYLPLPPEPSRVSAIWLTPS